MQDYKQYGALALAYMGDCVYEIRIREYLMARGNMPVNQLHKLAKQYVSAAAQSAIMDKLEPVLSEEEAGVYRRGRNAKSYTVPKNAVLGDYKRATGLEALFGYLYLTEQQSRIDALMEIVFCE